MLWSKEEDNIIKNNFGKFNLSSLIKFLPNRTSRQIQYRARKMGLKSYNLPQNTQKSQNNQNIDNFISQTNNNAVISSVK